MPENIKALRRRVRSIKNTGKITRAMEMVSAAKLRRTQAVMNSARPFSRKLSELLGRLAQSEFAKANPLFEVRPEGARLLVIVTADRGLCGAFNATIIKAARKELTANPDYKVFAVGRKGRDFVAKYFKDRLVGEVTDFGGSVDPEKADRLGERILNYFISREYREITILSTEYISTVASRPRISRFLPVEASSFGVTEAAAAASVDYILEPSPERVFEAVLPRYLKASIYVALAETFTSEHSARMLAMNNATKNCKELVTVLTLRANKIRQAAITKEIIEIVSGAEAAG
jgi:F-type H+-transporting ATPase subunit gamma